MSSGERSLSESYQCDLVDVEPASRHQAEAAQAGQADRDRLRRRARARSAADSRQERRHVATAARWSGPRGHAPHRPLGLVAEVPAPDGRLLAVAREDAARTRCPAGARAATGPTPSACPPSRTPPSRCARAGTRGSRRARTGWRGRDGPPSRSRGRRPRRSDRRAHAACRRPRTGRPRARRRSGTSARRGSRGRQVPAAPRRGAPARGNAARPPSGCHAFAPKSSP